MKDRQRVAGVITVKHPLTIPEGEGMSDDEVDDGDYRDLMALIRAFVNLGFDEWTSFLLAWRNCSPSQARELMKKGCPKDLVADILC